MVCELDCICCNNCCWCDICGICGCFFNMWCFTWTCFMESDYIRAITQGHTCCQECHGCSCHFCCIGCGMCPTSEIKHCAWFIGGNQHYDPDGWKKHLGSDFTPRENNTPKVQQQMRESMKANEPQPQKPDETINVVVQQPKQQLKDGPQKQNQQQI